MQFTPCCALKLAGVSLIAVSTATLVVTLARRSQPSQTPAGAIGGPSPEQTSDLWRQRRRDLSCFTITNEPML